ncbi:tetratricopeptide repeat protein [Candidatus Sumerlaeota bacterium]|nr:tetratricopeptide repeat protein [Candidatus Sumerlaeota bacterium]
MDEKKNNLSTEIDIAELQLMFESGRNPLAFIPYAEALRGAGHLNMALEVCKTGILQDEESITGRTLLARILYDMGRYDDALEELANVLQKAHDAFGTNLLMAKILAKKREYHDAMDIVQSIKNMNPLDTDLNELKEFLHSQIFSMETRGDLSDNNPIPYKTSSLDARVDELLRHLRSLPEVMSFSFTKLPDEEEDDKHDADLARNFFIIMNRLAKDHKIGNLVNVVLELERYSLLMFCVEGSLLKIVLKPNVNLGRLRLQIEQILKF